MPSLLERLRHKAAQQTTAAPMAVAAPRGLLSVCFDDFPVTAWTEGGAVLAAHGARGTYYVAGGLCGGVSLDLPQFEVAHLQAAAQAGHEIGCHSFGHLPLTGLSQGEMSASLDRNAAWLAERLDGRRPTTFAYPLGYVSGASKRAVAARFACGRGVRDGINAGRSDRSDLRAVGLESRRLPGYDLEALVRSTAERAGWLIAYGHDVSDRPTPYGCRPVDVDRLLRLARNAGLHILPVAEALALATAARPDQSRSGTPLAARSASPASSAASA